MTQSKTLKEKSSQKNHYNDDYNYYSAHNYYILFSIFEYLPVMDVLLKVEEDVVFCSLFGDVSTSM